MEIRLPRVYHVGGCHLWVVEGQHLCVFRKLRVAMACWQTRSDAQAAGAKGACAGFSLAHCGDIQQIHGGGGLLQQRGSYCLQRTTQEHAGMEACILHAVADVGARFVLSICLRQAQNIRCGRLTRVQKDGCQRKQGVPLGLGGRARG